MPLLLIKLPNNSGAKSGDGSVELTGFASAELAQPGDLTFAENENYFVVAEQSPATAILVSGDVPFREESSHPRAERAGGHGPVAAGLFPPEQHPSGIHASAIIAASAQIDPTAHVGPNCVVGARVRLGAHSVLMGGNHIGRDCQIGDDVCLFPNVVIYAQCQIGHRVCIHAGTVIGSDGYGYVFDEGQHRKSLQVGNVIIHDDVEIGANTAIDLGAVRPPSSGRAPRLIIWCISPTTSSSGRHCLVMGQVGFAGSTQLGDYCVIASQSGIAGHLKLGHQATVGAKSGVMRDIPDKGTVLGIPAAPDKQAKRQMIALQQLPELIRRTRELEKQVAELQAKAGA